MADEYQVCEAIVHPAVRVILEEGPNNWSAYVPSIPGCISTGKTRADTEHNIEEALSSHLKWIHEDAMHEEAAAAGAERHA